MGLKPPDMTPCAQQTRQAVRVAFIGAGSMAREHLRAFQAHADTVLTGIHSKTLSRAENLAREYSLPHTADSIDSLYQSTQAELVVIAVSVQSVGEILKTALSYPWAVLVEKPPGLDYHEACALHRLAEERSRRVFVGLNRRHLSSTRALKEALEPTVETRFIKVQDQQCLEQARLLGHPEPVLAAWMYANSIHVIDYLAHLGRGEVTRITRLRPWDPSRPGTVLAGVEFSSGDHGLYEGIWKGPGPWAVAVHTALQMWELRPLEQARVTHRGSRTSTEIPVAEEDRLFKPGFYRQATEVLAALQGRPSGATTFSQALRTMQMVHEIFQS
jgi:predicted dehydrogenase